MIFKAKDIIVKYGEVVAVQQVNLSVKDGEIVTIIGANGAGKTTILLAISGLIALNSGSIWFKDQRIDQLEAHEISRLGVIQVPEGRRLFSDLNVEENLNMGAHLIKRKDLVSIAKKEIYDLFPILYDKRKQKAKTLSGGQQQMLAIGRGLMGSPQLLLLDEPSIGLSPLLVQELAKTIMLINETKNISIILVEQNANVALRVAHKGYVIELGKIVLEGNSDELLKNKIVKEAYLGD